ncbi:division/cell wall cluster transcriptional repressor MraZ [Novosphingobium huizhouense]|uniref:division/cell wall cluster transcriptional repressor MraZ n=1 Tax=Novosphingobium huizhouense TaxID=2866625 RepID=UPI001CD87071|nr:division/cell wall cluster transcriptional repressor MraZ [Novosphingobium huizhouense]
MAGGPSNYWGQGFSPRGEKSRFVLPADFRSTVRDASAGQRVLCLDKHSKHPCLVGFGLSRAESFAEQIAHEERVALERREDFDADMRAAQLFGFMRVSFDESGRFVLPDHLGEQASIGEALYFHGGGSHFTIWAPDVLFGMGPGWDAAKATCRALMAEAAGKGRRK